MADAIIKPFLQKWLSGSRLLANFASKSTGKTDNGVCKHYMGSTLFVRLKKIGKSAALCHQVNTSIK